MDESLAVRIGEVIEAQRRMGWDVDNLKRWAAWAQQRIEALDRQQQTLAVQAAVPAVLPLRKRAAAFAREVASPAQWVLGLVTAVALMTGIVTADDLRDAVRHQLGLPPLNASARAE